MSRDDDGGVGLIDFIGFSVEIKQKKKKNYSRVIYYNKTK